MKKLVATAIAAVATVAASTAASAWTAAAHHLIGTMAYGMLDPAAKAEVDRLISTAGASIATPSCPIRNVRDAAVWSDCIRKSKEADPTGHTERITMCKPIVPMSWCRQGQCPSAQVQAAIAILRDRRAPDAAKMRALADTIHLVGDVHQPMHSTERRKGGYPAIGLDGKLTDLHPLWDLDISHAAIALGGHKAAYIRQLAAAHRAEWSRGTMADWTMESHQVAVNFVFPKAGDTGCPIPTTPVHITQAYLDAAAPVAAKQIAEAADRLAYLLNGTLT